VAHLCLGGLAVQLDQQDPDRHAGDERQTPNAGQPEFQRVQRSSLFLVPLPEISAAQWRFAIRLL
jgi:hypothetical protein